MMNCVPLQMKLCFKSKGRKVTRGYTRLLYRRLPSPLSSFVADELSFSLLEDGMMMSSGMRVEFKIKTAQLTK